MSRRRDAAREVRRGLERYPSNPDPLGAPLSFTCAPNCQRDERAAQRVLSLHPQDARARFAFARALLRRGKLPEARNQLQIAAEQPDGAEARPLLRRIDRLLSVL